MKVAVKRWVRDEPKIMELADIIGVAIHNSDRDGALEDVDARLGKAANAISGLLTLLCERNIIFIAEALKLAGVEYEYNEVKAL